MRSQTGCDSQEEQGQRGTRPYRAKDPADLERPVRMRTGPRKCSHEDIAPQNDARTDVNDP